MKRFEKIKVSVAKWSSNNEYSKTAITKIFVAGKHGHVDAVVLTCSALKNAITKMMAMPRWPADQEPGVAVAARVPGGHPVAAPAGDAAGGRVPQECSLQLWSVWAGRVFSQRLGSRVCGQSPRYRLPRESYSGRQRERDFQC